MNQFDGKFRGPDLLDTEPASCFAEDLLIKPTDFGRGVFGKGRKGKLLMVSQAVATGNNSREMLEGLKQMCMRNPLTMNLQLNHLMGGPNH